VKPITFKEINEFKLDEDELETKYERFATNIPEKFRNAYIELDKNRFYIERTIKLANQKTEELMLDSEITVFEVEHKFPYITKI
jgi:hypothetical protein